MRGVVCVTLFLLASVGIAYGVPTEEGGIPPLGYAHEHSIDEPEMPDFPSHEKVFSDLGPSQPPSTPRRIETC